MSEKEPIVRGVGAVEQILQRLERLESRLETLVSMIQNLPEYQAMLAEEQRDAMSYEDLCRETLAAFSEEVVEDVDEFIAQHTTLQ